MLLCILAASLVVAPPCIWRHTPPNSPCTSHNVYTDVARSEQMLIPPHLIRKTAPLIMYLLETDLDRLQLGGSGYPRLEVVPVKDVDVTNSDVKAYRDVIQVDHRYEFQYLQGHRPVVYMRLSCEVPLTGDLMITISAHTLADNQYYFDVFDSFTRGQYRLQVRWVVVCSCRWSSA